MKRLLVMLFFLILLFYSNIKYSFCQVVQQSNQRDESGFIQIDPVHYYFHFSNYFTRLALTTSPARMWYTFLVADQDSETKPLFVFFNGGPGGATTDGLMSHNTARMTQDTSTEVLKDEFISNPYSWTKLGNLLYVDARQTGFSYNLMDNPQNGYLRFLEFGVKNFNSYMDGADFVRLLLEFLARHPVIQNNPVFIVGESYGGIRTTVMLHLLLNYKDYGDGTSIFQDPGLVATIQNHYNRVFPEYQNEEISPAVIAKQFSRQILVQPAITGEYQNQIAGQMFEAEGSVIFQLADEIGTTYVPCRNKSNQQECNPESNAFQFVANVGQRDLYMYSKPVDWMAEYFNNASRLVQNTYNLINITNFDVTLIPELYANARGSAYRLWDLSGGTDLRIEDLPWPERYQVQSSLRTKAKLERTAQDIKDMPLVFGFLHPWDFYHVGLNYDANWAFYVNIAMHRGYSIHPLGTPIGDLFLENVVHVKTFITNAKYDLVIFSPAIPPALAMHTNILSSTVHDHLRPRSERPGSIILTYRGDAFPEFGNIGTQVIRFPRYNSSCHCVPLTQPEEMFMDVLIWLAEESGSDAPTRGGQIK